MKRFIVAIVAYSSLAFGAQDSLTVQKLNPDTGKYESAEFVPVSTGIGSLACLAFAGGFMVSIEF